MTRRPGRGPTTGGARPTPGHRAAVAAVLTAKGWRPAPAPENCGPERGGDFALREEPATEERPYDSVVLWCLTDNFVSTLAAMTGVLEESGYTAEDAPDVDSVRVRPATTGETSEREALAREPRRHAPSNRDPTEETWPCARQLSSAPPRSSPQPPPHTCPHGQEGPGTRHRAPSWTAWPQPG
ncbi:hypothetical protein GCM10010441_29620 [Kitasatospora paracochleata]|uniref:Uncharacterized protein n=1 Tax=Kitasatospora paracochleata TaxID=58354 RepID=A0ABT1J969_9ACTN|nr:hypothetical protein [Kitasatospora paracochleata]